MQGLSQATHVREINIWNLFVIIWEKLIVRVSESKSKLQFEIFVIIR